MTEIPTTVKEGFIYFVSNGEAIKIGYSTDVTARIRDLQVAHSEPLELLGDFPGDRIHEKQLHKKFAGIRLMGEWFEMDDELLDFIQVLKGPRMTIEGALTPPKPKERNLVRIPKGADDFSKWAGLECPKWPIDLMKQAATAADALHGRYASSPEAIATFEANYKIWREQQTDAVMKS